MHLAAVVGKVVRCGGAIGCQTDGGSRKTMTKRHRRSHGGRDITPSTGSPMARHQGATTPPPAQFHVSEEENTNPVQRLEKLEGQEEQRRQRVSSRWRRQLRSGPKYQISPHAFM